MVDQLTITTPDDWHVHLRDERMLQRVVADTARSFRRAIVMPNLRPPVTTVSAAQAYRDRIQSACPEGVEFTPLMTAYLTDDISPEEIERGFRAGARFLSSNDQQFSNLNNKALIIDSCSDSIIFTQIALE